MLKASKVCSSKRSSYVLRIYALAPVAVTAATINNATEKYAQIHLITINGGISRLMPNCVRSSSLSHKRTQMRTNIFMCVCVYKFQANNPKQRQSPLSNFT